MSKCQRKCGKSIKPKDKLILKSSGKIDRQSNWIGNREWFTPFLCLKTFSEQFCESGYGFDVSKIKIDDKSRIGLNKNDLSFLSSFGIQ